MNDKVTPTPVDVPAYLYLTGTEVKPIWSIAMARILHPDVTLRFADDDDRVVKAGTLIWDRKLRRMYLGNVPDAVTFQILLEAYIDLQINVAKVPAEWPECVKAVFRRLQKQIMTPEMAMLYEPALTIGKARNQSDYHTKYIAALRRVSSQIMRHINEWLNYAKKYAVQQQLFNLLPVDPATKAVTIRRGDFYLPDMQNQYGSALTVKGYDFYLTNAQGQQEQVWATHTTCNWLIIDNTNAFDDGKRPPFEVRHILDFAPPNLRLGLLRLQPNIVGDPTQEDLAMLRPWIVNDQSIRLEPGLHFGGPASSEREARGLIRLLSPCFESIFKTSVLRTFDSATGEFQWKMRPFAADAIVAPDLSHHRIWEVLINAD